MRIIVCLCACILAGCLPKHINVDSGGCLSEIKNSEKLPDFSVVGDGKIKMDSQSACDFFCEFKEAVADRDKKKVASMVRYPIDATINRKVVLIKTREDFIKNYEAIMLPFAEKVVLNQDVLKLWGSWQGVIVGKGEVWINKDKSGALKVIAILNWENVHITR